MKNLKIHRVMKKGQCGRLHAQIVELKLKSLLNRMENDQYIVRIVIADAVHHVDLEVDIKIKQHPIKIPQK
jgi:hypothetical protein